MTKFTLVKVSLSCTALLKSKCKFCGIGPSQYYYSILEKSYFDINALIKFQQKIKNNIKQITSSWYMMESPSFIRGIELFSHHIYYNKYDLRSHKTYGYHPKNSNIVDHLSCSCGKTIWCFNQTSGAKNPLINQKRLKSEYTKKVIY